MCTYTAVAIAATLAEFPTWGLGHCMAVFDLDMVGDKKAGLSEDVLVRLGRLATLCKVDAENLVREFRRILPLALAERDSHPGCSSVDAWSKARVSKRPSEPSPLLNPLGANTTTAPPTNGLNSHMVI